MLSERSREIIRKSSGQLKQPVRLVLFTADRGCDSCPIAVELGHAIKQHIPSLALEVYDMVMDRDKTEQYRVSRVPSAAVQGLDGRSVLFSGLPEEVFLQVLMDTISAVSFRKNWFPDTVNHALENLAHDVRIRVFVKSDCMECKPVAETAIGLAFEHRFISTEIIIVKDLPELVRHRGFTALPVTVFNENLFMEGHLTESAFLEMVFQAEGMRPVPERKCLVCSSQSPEIICVSCRTKIQAEAIDHKTRLEKGSQSA